MSVALDIQKKAVACKSGVLRVSALEFASFVRELNAKVELDEQGEFVTLHVMRHRVRLEPIAPGVPTQGDTPR